MGVDIYGRNPVIKGKQPELNNWETASDDEKEAYFKDSDEWYTNNPGAYFRSNWWGWRPIHAIADATIECYELPLDTNSWGSNDGAGLETQEQCDMLANAMEKFIDQSRTHISTNDDVIYLCLGSWVTFEGSFVPEKDVEELNQRYPIGTVLYNGVVTNTGNLVFPSHSSSLGHIKSFINFLRYCGGFEIW